MSESYSLPTEPEGVDHTEIAAELERDLKYGLPLKAKVRHVFVAGDIAQGLSLEHIQQRGK